MAKSINSAQRIHFDRLRLGSFNEFDGERVARGLEENAGLWDAFVFGRFSHPSLIELRDIPAGIVNSDELFILTTIDRVERLMELAKKWSADEIGWLTGDRTEGDFVCDSPEDMLGEYPLPENLVLVRVWWD